MVVIPGRWRMRSAHAEDPLGEASSETGAAPPQPTWPQPARPQPARPGQLSRRTLLALLAAAPLACRGEQGPVRLRLLMASGAMALAIDEQALYCVTGPAAGVLVRARHDGQQVRALLAGLSWARALCVRDGYLYLGIEDRVVRVPARGGPSELVAARSRPHRIAVDATHVYWIERASGRVCRAPRAGGKTATVAQARGWLADLALDAAHVYVTSDAYGSLARVRKRGGSLELLATGRPGAGALVIDGDQVCWTSAEAVLRTPVGGGATETLAGAQHSPACLIKADGQLLWVRGAGRSAPGLGEICVLPLRDRRPERILARNVQPQGLAYRHGQLYFADAATRALMRLRVVQG